MFVMFKVMNVYIFMIWKIIGTGTLFLESFTILLSVLLHFMMSELSILLLVNKYSKKSKFNLKLDKKIYDNLELSNLID